jgi:hypothetical protein
LQQGGGIFVQLVPTQAIGIQQLNDAVEAIDDSGVDLLERRNRYAFAEFGDAFAERKPPGLLALRLSVTIALEQEE